MGRGVLPPQNNANGNGVNNRQRPDVNSWKTFLYEKGKQACANLLRERPDETLEILGAMPLETYVETIQAARNTSEWLTHDPELSETEIDEEIHVIATELQKLYLPVTLNGNGHERAAAQHILLWQNQEQVTIANAEYLARPEIVERLGYGQRIALMIGAKHNGKTTNVRTLALSVLRGLPIWNRATTAGPVIYVASNDEVASTQHELLAMGWQKGEPLYFAQVERESRATAEEILAAIGEKAIAVRAVLIILDMLFDFVPIKDELKYQDTRQAMNWVQKLADETKCLVVGSHHTPKYLSEIHNAANAALGSQGVSARFSPIILTRKYADTLFTVESTTTRDPRGEMLKPTKIIRNERGWIEAAGEFKEWMKWEIYAQRVLDVFNGTRGMGVMEIAERLDLPRPKIQNTVKQLVADNKLKREKHGRSYVYYLANASMFEREGGSWASDAKDY